MLVTHLHIDPDVWSSVLHLLSRSSKWCLPLCFPSEMRLCISHGCYVCYLPCCLAPLYVITVPSHIAVRSNCMCIERQHCIVCAHQIPTTTSDEGCTYLKSLVWKCYLGMKSTLKVPDTVVFKKFVNLYIHVIRGIHPFQYCDGSWLVPSNWGLHHVCWVSSNPLAVVQIILCPVTIFRWMSLLACFTEFENLTLLQSLHIFCFPDVFYF